MQLGICGYGYTGSGAIIDLLKGFDSASVCDSFEFSIVYTPDGIEDLRFELVDKPTRYMSSDIAISRFLKYTFGKKREIDKYTHGKYSILTESFINSLVKVKWRGYWMFDYFTGGFWRKNFDFRILHAKVITLLSKFSNKAFDIPPVRDMYISVISEEEFDRKAKDYICSIIYEMSEGEKNIVVLNQPFPANNPQRVFKYFDNPKAIVVERDPRDLYALLKNVITSKCRFIPTGNVDDFITYYKCLHTNVLTDNDNVMVLQFEDLMYEFDKTLKKICDFLGIDAKKYNNETSQFDPAISIENTQVYCKYMELSHDIKRIEEQLTEYLYPFESKTVQPKGGKTDSELLYLADK